MAPHLARVEYGHSTGLPPRRSTTNGEGRSPRPLSEDEAGLAQQNRLHPAPRPTAYCTRVFLDVSRAGSEKRAGAHNAMRWGISG